MPAPLGAGPAECDAASIGLAAPHGTARTVEAERLNAGKNASTQSERSMNDEATRHTREARRDVDELLWSRASCALLDVNSLA